MSQVIWDSIKAQAKRGKVKTHALGYVGFEKKEDGQLVGIIPDELQQEAHRHGLVIEAALFKEGRYVIRKERK